MRIAQPYDAIHSVALHVGMSDHSFYSVAQWFTCCSRTPVAIPMTGPSHCAPFVGPSAAGVHGRGGSILPLSCYFRSCLRVRHYRCSARCVVEVCRSFVRRSIDVSQAILGWRASGWLILAQPSNAAHGGLHTHLSVLVQGLQQ